MGWPRIPNLIHTDRVTWQPITGWTQDAALGRVPAYGTASSQIVCTVQPEQASMIDEHGRQAMLVNHTVITSTNPGFKIRDQLIWLEGGKILTIVGVQPTGDARGRIWELNCEERPTL